MIQIMHSVQFHIVLLNNFCPQNNLELLGKSVWESNKYEQVVLLVVADNLVRKDDFEGALRKDRIGTRKSVNILWEFGES